ncbi:MAG: sigma-70 family RNA polymerase sigma factor [Clostridia bacterium]|nr:sigma-70 family RNA polymerase sigma factor [Clostridia bacterium]
MQDFEEIYAEYYARVYKYMMSLCQNPSLAEEITQEAFFKALKGIGSFKGDCKISSWLCQIAKNCYYSHLDRERARRNHLPEMPPGSMDIEARFVEKEAAGSIHRVLHKLKEPYKEVFWLKTFGELSFREIGDLFGKGESWGRVTYYRAKMMIREELE